jgi:hypothetical protein
LVAGLPQTLAPPADPETIRGAKEWLDLRMKAHGCAARIDQAALAARFDIDLARRRSPSFDKFCRQIERLIRAGLAGANRTSGSSL